MPKKIRCTREESGAQTSKIWSNRPEETRNTSRTCTLRGAEAQAHIPRLGIGAHGGSRVDSLDGNAGNDDAAEGEHIREHNAAVTVPATVALAVRVTRELVGGAGGGRSIHGVIAFF